MKRPVCLILLFTSLFGALAAPPGRSGSSLSDLDLENAETRLALEKALVESRHQQQDIVMLQEKLAVSEAAAARLSESVAIANAEAEVFRRQAGELKLRLEALGIGGATGNVSKLEERVLEAYGSFRHAEEERQKLNQGLLTLSEVARAYAKKATSPDAESRVTLEAALRHSSELLGTVSPNAVEGSAAAATLSDGMVISTKEELGLVVANIGLKQGVAVGMPFQVLRENHLIATVRVVDVRDRIAGAVIQDLTSDKTKIQVGDRLKIAARQ